MAPPRKAHFKKSYKVEESSDDEEEPRFSSSDDDDDSTRPARSTRSRSATSSVAPSSTSSRRNGQATIEDDEEEEDNSSSDESRSPSPPPRKRLRRGSAASRADRSVDVEEDNGQEGGRGGQKAEKSGKEGSAEERPGPESDVEMVQREGESEEEEEDDTEDDDGAVAEQEVDPALNLLPPRRIRRRYPDVRLFLRHTPGGCAKLVVYFRTQAHHSQGKNYELCPAILPFTHQFDMYGEGIEGVAENHEIGVQIARYLISAFKRDERGDVRSGISTLDGHKLEAGIREILEEYIVPSLEPISTLPTLPSVLIDSTHGFVSTQLPASLGGRRYHIYPDRLDLAKCPDDPSISSILAVHNNSEGSARRLLLSNDAATRAAAALAVQIRKTAESDEWMEHSEVVKWIASHYEGEHGSRRNAGYRIRWFTPPPRKTPPRQNVQLTVTVWTGMKRGEEKRWYLPTGDTEDESQRFEAWATDFEKWIKTDPIPTIEEVVEAVEKNDLFDVNSRDQYVAYYESIGWNKSNDPFDYGDDIASRILRCATNSAVDPGRWGGTPEKLERMIFLRHKIVVHLRSKVEIKAVNGKQSYVAYDGVSGSPLFHIATDASLSRDETKKFVAMHQLSLHHYWQTAIEQLSDKTFQLQPNTPMNLVLTTWAYNEAVFRWPGGLQELLLLLVGYQGTQDSLVVTDRLEDSSRFAILQRMRVLIEQVYRAWHMCCPREERERQGVKEVLQMIMTMESIKDVLGLELFDAVPRISKIMGKPIDQIDFLDNSTMDLPDLPKSQVTVILNSQTPASAESLAPRPGYFLRSPYKEEEKDLTNARKFCEMFNAELMREKGFFLIINSDGIFTLTGDITEGVFANRLVMRKLNALATAGIYQPAFGSNPLVVLAEIAHSHAEYVAKSGIGNLDVPVGVYLACQVTGLPFTINASKAPLQLSFARKAHKDVHGNPLEHTSGYPSPSRDLSLDDLLHSRKPSHSNFHLASAFANQMEGPGTAKMMQKRLALLFKEAKVFFERSPAAFIVAETFTVEEEEKWKELRKFLHVDDPAFQAVEVVEEVGGDEEEEGRSRSGVESSALVS